MSEELKGKITWDVDSAVSNLLKIDKLVDQLTSKLTKFEGSFKAINSLKGLNLDSAARKVKQQADSIEKDLNRAFSTDNLYRQKGGKSPYRFLPSEKEVKQSTTDFAQNIHDAFKNSEVQTKIANAFSSDSLKPQKNGASPYRRLATEAARDSADVFADKIGEHMRSAPIQSKLGEAFSSDNIKPQRNGLSPYRFLPENQPSAKLNMDLDYALFGRNAKRDVSSAQANTNLQKISGQWEKSLVNIPKNVEAATTTSLGSIIRFAEATYIAILGSQVVSHLIDTTNRLQGVAITFKAVTKDQKVAAEEMDWIKTKAKELGQNYLEASQSYAKFYAASKNIMPKQQIKDIYESLMITSTVLHKQPYEFRLMALALEQMASKGKVSTEELRRQLGEHLPGAIDIAARSMGVTQKQLMKMLQDGTLMASDFLPKFAKTLKEDYINGLDSAKKSTQTMLGQMSNAWLELEETLAKSGFIAALGNIAKTLTGIISNPLVVGLTSMLGVAINLFSILLPLILTYLTAYVAELAAVWALTGNIPIIASWIAKIILPLNTLVGLLANWLFVQKGLNLELLRTTALNIASSISSAIAPMLAMLNILRLMVITQGVWNTLMFIGNMLNPLGWLVLAGVAIVAVWNVIVWIFKSLVNLFKYLYDHSLAFRLVIESIIAPFVAIEKAIRRIYDLWIKFKNVFHLGNPLKSFNDNNDINATKAIDMKEYAAGRPSIQAFLDNNKLYGQARESVANKMYSDAMLRMRNERGMSNGKIADKVEINHYIDGAKSPEEVGKEVNRHNKNYLEDLFYKATHWM